MKQIIFNVQIQAEFCDGKQIGRRKAAHLLCQAINKILAKHNGSKVTVTVLGPADDPGSMAILEAFALK